MEACLRYPWSVVAALVYVYLLVMIYVLSDKRPSLKALYGRTSCIISLTLAVLGTLVVGITSAASLTSTLPFILVEALLMSTIGLSSIDDLMHIKSRPVTAVLAHLGVFLVLLAAIFGRGDKEKLILVAELDQPVTYATDHQGRSATMPFMLTLKSFEMDVYEAEVHSSSEAWDVSVQQYIDMAMPEGDAYKALKHTGAAPAAYVKATEGATGQSVEGWVSCGSHILASTVLELPDGAAVYMLQPAPKEYRSRVDVIDPKGDRHDLNIRVNHPGRIGPWYIYQYNYDTAMGRWSTTSVFECVKDPWYALAWPAMILILCSAAFAFLGRRSGKKEVKK